MPIDLTNLQANVTQIKTYSPKFFHKDLTGAGKKIGLLNEARNPANLPGIHPVTSEYFETKKKEITNGDTTTTYIPVSMLSKDAWEIMDEFKIPADAEKIATCLGPKPITAKVVMRPHSLMIEKKTFQGSPNGGQAGTSKKLTPCYQIFVFLSNDPDPVHVQILGTQRVSKIPHDASANAKNLNAYFITYSCDPVSDLDVIKDALEAAGYTMDKRAYGDFIQNYSLYDAVCKCSEMWQTEADKLLSQLFKNNVAHHNGSYGKNQVAHVLHQIENYAIPLDCYRQIYQDVKATYTTADLHVMCKQNLNLLLTDTLDSLHKNKTNLNHMVIPATGPVVPPSAQRLSAEQLRAVSSTDPLVLVQSGAGTGKALPLDEPVLTPAGWTTMGELRVGDEVVGSDGKPTKVVRIHEQGLKSGYKITFRDGSSVHCCGEHLWDVRTKYRDGERSRIMTTEEWLNADYERQHGYVPAVKPVEFAERNLPVDPYFLGALLADGTSVFGRYNPREPFGDDRESASDAVTSATIEAAGRSGFRVDENTLYSDDGLGFYHADDKPGKTDVLNDRLHALGLNRRDHIPAEYLTASVEQRVALLNGLFDNGGNIRENHEYAQFRTESERLADDILHLLWSLGLSAVKDEVRGKWNVNVLSDYDPFEASPDKGKTRGTSHPLRRTIRTAEPIDPVPMRCIEVDAEDKLYVTKDFIVTHNSTVILSRIQYMTANGVNPDDITVLSFTNAAADHIIEKNPDVHAMTIARMIHSIYETNFPNHELSSLDTIMNSLDIYYPNDPVAAAFKKLAPPVIHNEPDAVTNMNNFIEQNFDAVISMLNTMGQTSLELEIIICYQRIETFQEPPEVQSKHLIIDEVQDNSVFEFIYALKYVEKHNESLFIVGDCSQTLYEFRSSDPRALNVLEGSGVFSTYQLQVNYRSNQEILDFANVLLQNIEANQYANIQLRANSLRPVTEQSFNDAVHFKYHELRKLAELNDRLPTIIANDLRPYLTNCMAKKERVAFLAYKKKDVNAIENQLRLSYPSAQIAKLVPDRVPNSVIFSNFIRKFWGQVSFAPQQNIVGAIVRMVIDNLSELGRYKGNDLTFIQKKAGELLVKWQTTFGAAIAGWVAQANAGQISNTQLLDLIKESMLKMEIQDNAARQAVIGDRNRQRKEDQANMNADFVLSTIHSAKGLEFDHVVVILQNKNYMPEDEKRMYYVALTRAMKSEYVIAYDIIKKPKIQADYETIVKQLHAIAPAPTPSSAATPKPAVTPGGHPSNIHDERGILSDAARYAILDDVNVERTVVGADVTKGVPKNEASAPDANSEPERPSAKRDQTFVVPTIPLFPPDAAVAS